SDTGPTLLCNRKRVLLTCLGVTDRGCANTSAIIPSAASQRKSSIADIRKMCADYADSARLNDLSALMVGCAFTVNSTLGRDSLKKLTRTRWSRAACRQSRDCPVTIRELYHK